MRIGYKSDVGKQRELDEDSLLIANLSGVTQSMESEWTILAVADGAGGQNSGEVASRIGLSSVTEKLAPLAFYQDSLNLEDIGGFLEEAIHHAHRQIVENWRENPAREGMATTMSLALINGSDMYVGHVGDSRVYLITEDIEQVTKDHSYVQQLLDSGAITEEEAKDHPQKNVITQALGGKEEPPEVGVYYRSVYEDDKVLICCDGVTDVIGDEKLFSLIAKNGEQEVCEEIVDLANHRGGPDNISLIVVRPAQLEEKRKDVVGKQTEIRG